jgi:phospholipase C
LINALMSSEAWSTSAFMWTYDDWGGWYDHVPPPSVDEFGYGFRVPALLVSPYAKQGFIDGTTLDFTSILKFIEDDNYNLEPLAARDQAANSIANAFDFTQPPRFPSIISSVRNETGLVIPWRPAIYGTYGVAFAIPVVLIVAALFEIPDRRRRRLPSIRISWGDRS